MFVSRLKLIAAFLSGVLLLTCLGCHRSVTTGKTPPKLSKPLVLAIPDKGAYTGAYIAFGDREDDLTLEGIEEFENQVGKHQAIIAFSSFWGEQRFPIEAANIVTRHGAVPLIFWSPWDWPYREDLVEVHGPDQFNLENILGGRWDAYIDRWADAARATETPILVSLCNEMNGNWFPWSGIFYGGGRSVAGTNPPQYVGPEYFKRAYRYIVDRVRARGAANISWVFHVNNFPEPYEPWNSFAQYYPGTDYVDWLGLSVYGQMYPEDNKWDSFDDMIKDPYDELAKLDPAKPMMLTEWGVGEFPRRGDKSAWITTAFDHMIHSYPRLRAAIYWHERWQNNKTMLYSDLRLNSSPAALEAYRRGVSTPYWLGQPNFR